MTDQPPMPEGAMRLEADLRILLLMLNEARYRTMAAAFGLSREQTNLASLVLLGMAAHAAGERVHRMLSSPPFPPASDVMLGIAGVRELAQSIAGPASRDTSMFGTLVAVAAMGGVCVPAVQRTIRAFESAAHEVALAFKHRYGRHSSAAAAKVRGLRLRRQGD